jgi:hypothetical protein
MPAILDSINRISAVWLGLMGAILWQSTLVVLLVTLVALLLRHASPRVRYWLWQIVAIKFLLMPFWVLAVPWLFATLQSSPSAESELALPPVSPFPIAVPVRPPLPTAQPPAEPSPPPPAPSPLALVSWSTWLFLAWAGVVTWRIASISWQRYGLARLLRLPDDDFMKNKHLNDSISDTRRVYRFDAGTQRLEYAEVYLHQSTGDALILKTSRIEYNRPLDAKIFTLELPKDVRWFHETARLPDNEKYERMTPTQAAKAFFEACARQDWAEAEKFLPGRPMEDRAKKGLGGLTLIHLGEPFQSKLFARSGQVWFVPYEIKLKDGTVKKFNLAVSKDNPANRCVVGGGI